MIIPYLHNVINDHKAPMELKDNSRIKTQGEWKIQESMQANCISSKVTWQTRIMHIWSDNEEIMMGSEKDDIITESFKYFLENNQKEKQSINGSELIFQSVDL